MASGPSQLDLLFTFMNEGMIMRISYIVHSTAIRARPWVCVGLEVTAVTTQSVRTDVCDTGRPPLSSCDFALACALQTRRLDCLLHSIRVYWIDSQVTLEVQWSTPNL
jgi:hypothetical protein